MKPLRLHEEARAELNEAAEFYEERQPGVGRRWRLEVAKVLDQIQQRPRIGRREPSGARKYHMTSFPFYIVFVERSDDVFVLSFSHERREPGHWLGRLT